MSDSTIELPSLSFRNVTPINPHAGEDREMITLRNSDTGAEIRVPASYSVPSIDASSSSVTDHRASTVNATTSQLRRRIALVEPVAPNASVSVDWTTRRYRMSSYPPLGFLIGRKWYVILGALLIAACAQISFFFPCTEQGWSAVDFAATSTAPASRYCVRADAVPAPHPPSSCLAGVCAKSIPVTLQTFAVLLNGALAGRKTGVMAATLYVVVVALGAPFGAGGKSDPVWVKGSLIGPTGGFLFGFIVASFIMGICAEKGHDRPRSAYRLVAYMLAAELSIYACGLFWLPFGIAIQNGISPAAVCPAAAGAGPCLKNILSWGLVPFIPGEGVKMFLVLVCVPGAWQALLAYHKWKSGSTVIVDDFLTGAAAGVEAAPTALVVAPGGAGDKAAEAHGDNKGVAV